MPIKRLTTSDARFACTRWRGVVAIVCLFSLILPPAAADIQLPSLGSENLSGRSEEDEKRLGEAFLRWIRQQVEVIDDAEIDHYIQNLGYKLVANSDRPGQPFRFFVVGDPSINAFAGPAGYIGVHSGLLATAQDESELAAVMAHEIAHVTQNHLDRTMNEMNKFNIPTAAAILAAILLGSRDINVAAAAIATTQALSAQTFINFTRRHESEADHVGMGVLARSGYEPQAMARFFQRLQQNSRTQEGDIPEFLRTHPVTTTRIADARDRAGQFEMAKRQNDLLFFIYKERLRVLTSDNLQHLLRLISEELKDKRYQRREASLYGYAFVLTRLAQYDKALKVIDELIREDRERLPYLILKADIAAARDQFSLALRLYRDALDLNPNNPILIRRYAGTLLTADKAEEARRLLLHQLALAPRPPLYQLLAKAENNLNNKGAAYRYQAEYHYLSGQTRMAIEQLQIALKQRDIDNTESRQIMARLEELKSMERQERELLEQ